MNTLKSCIIERRNFGDLLSIEGMSRLSFRPARDLDSLLELPLPENSVLAIWPRDRGIASQLPNVIVCRDGTEGDWAAWITTFGAKIRPFSAFMRLIARSNLRALSTAEQTPTLGHLTWPIAGLILGEVLAASRLPDRALESLPANAFESTLSFAMFRALASYSIYLQWPELVESWELVRLATKQQTRLVESASVARVCATVIEASDLGNAQSILGQIDVLRACHDILKEPGLPPASLLANPHFTSFEARMHGPREERVIAFSEFVQSTDGLGPANRELTSFMLGYLASRIAPGTLQHSSVLAGVTQRYATALLWYGFCAGLGGSDGSTRNGVGGTRQVVDLPVSARRVARDLLRPEPILEAPTCDISFLELLALSRSENDPLAGLIRTGQGAANIELAPSVWTVVNVSSKLGYEGAGRSSKERSILSTMGQDIERLLETYHDLVGSDPFEAGQRSLFRSKQKKP